MPSFGIAFLKAKLPRKLRKHLDLDKLTVMQLIMKVIFSKDKKTLKSKFSEILKELKPYSQIPKYCELIRTLRHYVVYNSRTTD